MCDYHVCCIHISEESQIELRTQPKPLTKVKHFYNFNEKGWLVLNKERPDLVQQMRAQMGSRPGYSR